MKILLYRGRGPIAWATRFQTRSPYHHAAVLLPGGSHVVEAVYNAGVLATSTKGEVWGSAKKLTSVDIFFVETSATQEVLIREWLKEQLGKPYDLTMVLRFVTRKQVSRKTKGKWFCSELVFSAFLAAGIRLLERVEPWEVSPGLLARSPLLRYEQTVKV